MIFMNEFKYFKTNNLLILNDRKVKILSVINVKYNSIFVSLQNNRVIVGFIYGILRFMISSTL
jgi:hypothetical protein